MSSLMVLNLTGYHQRMLENPLLILETDKIKAIKHLTYLSRKDCATEEAKS